VANDHLEILTKAILQTKVRRIHFVSTLAKSQLNKDEAELATECLIKTQELLKVLQEMAAEKDSGS
jgi:hypothetical protein